MKIVERPTREAYDRWSITYDQKANPLAALDEEGLSPRLDLVGYDLRGKRALDLGCGTGRNSLRLRRLGAEVTGLDFSREMLALAANKSTDIRLIEHDLASPLPFADGTFDFLVCTLVLEHLESLEPVFTEMLRVCAPKGWIYLSDLHPTLRLRGGRAQFTDRVHGEEVQPRGYGHQVSEYVLSILRAGLIIEDMREHFGTASLVKRFPQTEPHLGWPMLLSFVLNTPGA